MSVIKEYISVNIDSLIDYEKNVKKHGANIDKIKKSIESDTYIAPIIIDENNVIIVGHWRRLALKELWYSDVDVLKISWLTEEQKKRYRIMDNKLSEISVWDITNLEDEIKLLVWYWDNEINDYFDIDLWLDDIDLREEDVSISRNYTKEDFDHSWIKTFILHFSDEEYVSLIETLSVLVESWKYGNDFSSVILNIVNESSASI